MKTQTVQTTLHSFTDLWKIKNFLEGNRVNLITLITLIRLYDDYLSKLLKSTLSTKGIANMRYHWQYDT